MPTTNQPLPLEPDTAHIHFCDPNKIPQSHLPKLEELLDPDEKIRLHRYRSPKAKQLFLIAHAILRQTLSAYCPEIAPPQWTFAIAPNGKPSLSGKSENHPNLQFNISHTNGLIACAFSTNRPLGIDVEGSQRDTHFLSLSKRFFAPEEHAALTQLQQAEVPHRFLAIWTLKEAYIKATGLGMALPLYSFQFAFPTKSTIRFTNKVPSAPHDFLLLHPTPHHFAALAIEQNNNNHTTPLIHECFHTLSFSKPVRIDTNLIATS